MRNPFWTVLGVSMATFGLRVVVKKSTLAEEYSRSMYNINIKSICIQYFFRILDDYLAFVKAK